jgi:hypothetical protein
MRIETGNLRKQGIGVATDEAITNLADVLEKAARVRVEERI